MPNSRLRRPCPPRLIYAKTAHLSITRATLDPARPTPLQPRWNLIALNKSSPIVLIVGCSQMLFGENSAKLLGLETVQIQIKQNFYLNAAFFASLLGLLLGLAPQLLTLVTRNVPIFGFLFSPKKETAGG